MKVAIIGSGMMGSALAFPARENGNDVRLVGTPLDRAIIEACRRTNRHPKLKADFPEGCVFFQIEEMAEAVKDADFVIGGVSSFGVDWFGEEVLPKLPASMPVLSVTKGLMDTPDGQLLTYPAVWESRLAAKGIKRDICAIGGPCTSYELVAHDQTEVAFCGKDLSVLRMLKEALATPYYHISLSTDVTGIESAVALKNGYALGIALTIGLNQKAFGIDSDLHFNSQAAVFGQALKEMKKLLDLQGAGTLENLCVGAGDLYVTVYGGRTRLVGILLGRGLDIDQAKAALEGVTLESLVVAERVARAVKVQCAAGRLNAADFPLLLHTDGILTEKKPVDIQYYTNRLENVRVEHGRLVLQGHRVQWKNPEFAPGQMNDWKRARTNITVTSGSVNTHDRFSFAHGRIECRAKVPARKGSWPAIWTLGADIGEVGWPRCGEIDILEFWGQTPDKVTCNVHGLSDKTGRHASPGACELRGQSPADGFHVYALEWDEREAVCFYDGVRYGAFPLGEYGGAFSRPHYILLNLALGAEWMMPESEVEVDDGTRFEIDWIRVYRKVAGDPLSK